MVIYLYHKTLGNCEKEWGSFLIPIEKVAQDKNKQTKKPKVQNGI